MRLWSIHPAYLDSKGLVALWREALLARAVLTHNTIGYKNHSQLKRFKATIKPVAAINYYLFEIYQEAESRGYHFDSTKLKNRYKKGVGKIPVQIGQIEYECAHLLKKLFRRNRKLYQNLKKEKKIRIHPLFCRVKGGIHEWEHR